MTQILYRIIDPTTGEVIAVFTDVDIALQFLKDTDFIMERDYA